ncbi:MAG: HEAT repeat domain-containing protein [Candidatus Wallbacteria bacterium]|nr:HEAT repeat domain-containing protein [Candidatus Wallbacteria bacterium]
MNLTQRLDSLCKASESDYGSIKNEILSGLTIDDAKTIITMSLSAEKQAKLKLLNLIVDVTTLPIQPLLIEAFGKEKDPDAKLMLTVSLGRNGNKKIISSLIELINNDNYLMKHKATLALQLIGSIALQELLIIMFKNLEANYPYAEMIADIIVQIPDKSLNDVEKILQIKNPLVAEILGSIDDPQVVPLLVEFFDKKNHLLSRSVKDALVRLGAKNADLLGDFLSLNNEEFNYWITRALASFGDLGRKILLEKINGASNNLIRNIIEVLDYKGEEVLKDLYFNLLLKGNCKTKEIVIEKVISCKDPTLLIEIKRLISDKLDTNSRFFLLYALSETGTGDEFLKEYFKGGSVERLIATLVKTRNPKKEDFNLLVSLLKEPDPFIKQAALNALAAIARDSFPQLLEATMIDHPEVRKNCLKLIRGLGREAVIILGQLLDRGNHNEKFQAAFVTGHLYLYDLKSNLEKLTNDGNEWVRKFARIALARMGGPDEVLKLLKSSQQENCDTAISLLKEDINHYAQLFLSNWTSLPETIQVKVKSCLADNEKRFPGTLSGLAGKLSGESSKIIASMQKQMELERSFQL